MGSVGEGVGGRSSGRCREAPTALEPLPTHAALWGRALAGSTERAQGHNTEVLDQIVSPSKTLLPRSKPGQQSKTS